MMRGAAREEYDRNNELMNERGEGGETEGVRRRCRSDETLSTDLKTKDQVRLKGKNDPCSSGAAAPRRNLLSPSLQPDLE